MISYHSYKEFGTPANVPKDENNGFDNYGLPIYVPYTKVRSHRVGSVVAIINSSDRIYIRDRNRTLHRKAANIVDDDEDNDDSDVDDAKSPLEGMGYLDLGIEPLRRIVHEMDRLTNEKTHFTFDREASKAAGLIPYCEYLKGFNKETQEKKSYRTDFKARMKAKSIVSKSTNKK